MHTSPAIDTPRVRPFRPASWVRGGHLQTILPAFFRRPPATYDARHRLELPDGDFVDLDLAAPPGEARGFVVVVHGLEGSSASPYVLGSTHVATRRGFHVVALNLRGCSGEPNRLARAYHAGDTEDLLQVLHWAAGRWPGLPGGLIGFSLGGNLTLRLLAREVELPMPLLGGVAISPPFDFFRVTRVLDSPLGFFYRMNFLRSLLPKVREKSRRFPEQVPPEEVARASRARSLRVFDDRLSAPIHGYDSVEDYYHRATAAPLLPGIRRPGLILAARNDPIVPGDTIPAAAIEGNPHLQLMVTEDGGHVGFLSGTVRQPRFWAEQQAVLWLTRTSPPVL